MEDGSRLISLTEGRRAIVDQVDYEKVSNHEWAVANGYPCTKIDKELICLHNFIMDNLGTDMHVDHRNRNKLDCRRVNLRLCTQSQNNINKPAERNSSSRYKGVTRLKRKNGYKWWVRIRLGDKLISLKYFDDEIEAAKAYDREAKILHGEFAYFNFPELQK